MDNLHLIKEYQNALWNDQDIQAIDQFFDKNAIIHSPVATTKGTKEMKRIILQWFAAFPDLKVYWDDFICNENKVVARWHATGTHQGEFLGHPPSHRMINYSGVTIYQLIQGKISEYWAFVDMHGILKQVTGK